MTRLILESPRSLWDGDEPATVYVLRLAPGQLEQIDASMAETFLAGAGPLPVAGSSVDLAKVVLRVEDAGDAFGLRSHAVLLRRPVDRDGRLDGPALDEIRRRPEEERRRAMGWSASDEEVALLSEAIQALEDEGAALDPEALAALLGFGTGGAPLPARLDGARRLR